MAAGPWLEEMNAKNLEKRVETLCHYSKAWPVGTTLLWPLYKIMVPQRAYTSGGRPYMVSEMVGLDGECKESLVE